MATESLIIELDAKTAKLDARLKTTEEKLEQLNTQTKKTDKGFKDFTKAAKNVSGKLKWVAAGALAVGTAITAMTLKAASSRKELEGFARQAKTTAEDFQALSFATSQYGINAEKIADISKDIFDKIGEFSAAGTGTFQDYADVMKLTKDEARSLAIEFQSLSGEEVIGRMVSEMEAAGTSGAQMTFVLESMGSDLSKLMPLYQGNSKELLTLKKRFTDVNDSLQITGIQAEKLKAVSTTYGLLTSQLGNAATAVSATIAPVMDDFFNDIIAVVPDATQSIIDFINTFLNAENITSIGGVQQQIKKVNEEIKLTTEEMIGKAPRIQKGMETQIKGDIRRREELEAQLVVLQEQEISLENANRLKGGSIDGSGGTSGVGTGDELQAIADRFKGEEQLLTEKLERELEVLGEHNANKAQLEQDFIANMADAVGADEEQLLIEKYDIELEKIAEHNQLKLDLEDQYLMDIVAMDQRAEDDKLAAKEKSEKDKLKISEKAAKAEEKLEGLKRSFAGRTAQTLLSSSLSTQGKLFSIVKDSAAAQIEAYGLTAGAKALAELGPIAGPPVMASYIGWSQVAAGVVRALPLGGGGGSGGSGGLSSGGGGGGFSGGNTGMGTNAPEQQNFEAEMSGLEIDDASERGSGVQTIRFAVDSGDDLIDAISNALNKANNEGR